MGTPPFSSVRTDAYRGGRQKVIIFKPIDQFVRSTMSRADLDAESVEAIGLKSRKAIKLNASECMGTARQLKLDKETVFDHRFWSKFETYVHEMAK
ncbi:hypothetical protein [Rhizobium leguminosarum]|uniref:hypothetical protein n=2 Tax=Rhizobium leguminosarum TaxID=384 RepID=UPI0014423B39|nr:hypothetical protein [Rhizobium leguminosarum]NKM78114.1 hypothetical protein [Rhizobium leguminosarum bv. viciae]